MAKFLIVLAAALLQASAAPLELNPFAWITKAPKMGLEIASNVVGGVRDGLQNNGMGFAAGPLDMVSNGLNVPVGMLGNIEQSMPSFGLPSFGGAADNQQGLGGFMSNMFALPQKFIGQGQAALGGLAQQGQGMFGGLAQQGQGMLGGLTDKVQGQVGAAQGKIQGAVGQVQQIAQEQLKKVQQLQKEMAPKANEMVSKIMTDLQKKGQEAAALGDANTVAQIRAQLEQVTKHANGLMGQLQAAQLPEEAQKIAEKFVNDFTPLYKEATAAASAAVQDVKAAVKDAKTEVKAAVEEAKTEVKAAVEEAKTEAKAAVEQ